MHGKEIDTPPVFGEGDPQEHAQKEPEHRPMGGDKDGIPRSQEGFFPEGTDPFHNASYRFPLWWCGGEGVVIPEIKGVGILVKDLLPGIPFPLSVVDLPQARIHFNGRGGMQGFCQNQGSPASPLKG